MARAARKPSSWTRLPLAGLDDLRAWFAREVGADITPADVLVTSGGQSALSIVFRRSHSAAVRQAVRNVTSILGLDPETQEFRVVFGAVPTGNKEIAMVTRSIFEVLLDISERGRSLGIILIGAQQTASQVETRIVANASVRVVGRLDLAEAERPEYGFLAATGRARAGILKPGTMIVQQPEIPAALLLRFPFPAWATRRDEAREDVFDDAHVFDGLADT